MKFNGMTAVNKKGMLTLRFYKKLLYSLPIILFALPLYSNASEGLTLSAIYDLKNPYKEKFNDPDFVEDSKEFIRFNALSDRFEYCQHDGMTTLLAFANHITVMKDAGSPETKFDAMKYAANQRNLEYPFDAEEIAGSSRYSVEKFALEMGWENPGSSDAHLESIASIFWEKCLQLPISIFEADWQETEDTTVYDEEGYDSGGYDKFGLTREDNR